MKFLIIQCIVDKFKFNTNGNETFDLNCILSIYILINQLFIYLLVASINST